MPDTYKVCMRCGTSLTEDFEDSVVTSEKSNTIEYSKRSNKLLRKIILSLFSFISIFFAYKIYTYMIGKIKFHNLQEVLFIILMVLLIIIFGAEIYQEKNTNFKKGFIKFFFIFFILALIIEFLLGSILVFFTIKYWIWFLTDLTISYIIYYGFKKILWFILEKIYSVGYLPFFIIYLGFVLPIIYLTLRHFT